MRQGKQRTKLILQQKQCNEYLNKCDFFTTVIATGSILEPPKLRRTKMDKFIKASMIMVIILVVMSATDTIDKINDGRINRVVSSIVVGN